MPRLKAPKSPTAFPGGTKRNLSGDVSELLALPYTLQDGFGFRIRLDQNVRATNLACHKEAKTQLS